MVVINRIKANSANHPPLRRDEMLGISLLLAE